MLENGRSQADIARALDRAKSSISREVRRNSVNGEYVPEKADYKADLRRRKASFRGKKIIRYSRLQDFVDAKLETGWSPELIAGRLKAVRANLPYVSKDTIYRYLDSVHGNGIDYQKDTTRRSNKQQQGGNLDDRTFIDKRPDVADTRGRVGDWELDFLESGQSSRAVLLVLVDRLSRFSVVKKLPDRREASVHEAVVSVVNEIPVKTITTDNDIAFKKHETLAEQAALAIYFCHPYCSWEKGSVEQVNKLLRSWIPKGSDIATYDSEFIANNVATLNDRPRACLDFRTPQEVMAAYEQIDTAGIDRDTLIKKAAKEAGSNQVERCI